MFELPTAPTPILPWDVLCIVFSFVDTPTLAVLGRVSYDVLVETGPTIYGSIVVKSVVQLSKLLGGFSTERPLSIPRITPHLSLNQCHSLTLDFSKIYSYLPSDYLALQQLTPSSTTPPPSFRLPSTPLPLTNLTILVHPSFQQIIFLLGNLLPHLNPLNVTYSSSSPFDNRKYGEFVSSDFGPSNLVSWTRLRTLTLQRLFPIRVNLARTESTLASLPREFLGRLGRVALDPSFGAEAPGFGITSMREFLVDWRMHLDHLGLDRLGDGGFVLVVKDEGRKRECEGVVASMREEFRKILRVEVG
ncbi:hypothetical protein BDY24DRAFT_401248 [Mrakia frigida]|uniref:uncharacterized protein n=1 Tax=Mrakia frigida TaxID=29902 RepID=UPI003FCBFE16